MKTLIKNAKIVNEGNITAAQILIDGDTIADIIVDGQQPDASADTLIDASGCCVIPGVIDTHVHFREPGLTDKADIHTESRAAAAGGITTYFDMPNTQPQTTTIEALEEKFRLAAEKSLVNYSFFFGATNDNLHLFPLLDPHRIPGIKLFMGSSTGNMLVDRDESLRRLFASTKLPIMAHCEDTGIINANMEAATQEYGTDPAVEHHPEIRSAEACCRSTAKAVALAKGYGARLHVAHLSTERELEHFEPSPSSHTSLPSGSTLPAITAEACVGHLFFTQDDHSTLGAQIKVNPAIKTTADRDALRRALSDGRITTIATDHAPHLLSQKQGGSKTATSGMPMIQFSLPTMLELVDDGVLTIERMVELMCHNPARLFSVDKRGFLRKGYKADIAIIRPDSPWTVTEECIESKCGWSPMTGHTYRWRVERTLCNGHTVYPFADGSSSSSPSSPLSSYLHSEAVTFRQAE